MRAPVLETFGLGVMAFAETSSRGSGMPPLVALGLGILAVACCREWGRWIDSRPPPTSRSRWVPVRKPDEEGDSR